MIGEIIRTQDSNFKNTLSRKVHDYLLEQIANQTLKPGMILKRREIASNLGVSYAPVVEACVQLEIEGFLITRPRQGTEVRKFDYNTISENLCIREALECQAARMYCGDPIKSSYDKLLSVASKIDESFYLNEPKNWNLEYEFHSALVMLANCSLLLKEFNRIMLLGSFYNLYDTVFNAKKINQTTYDSHVTLLDNLCNSDADQAERFIRYHLNTSSRLLSSSKG